MPISAADAINPAFQHAKQQLTQPFRFGQWVRLALVGFLAGEMGSGGGCNTNFSFPSGPHQRGSQRLIESAFSWQIAGHPAMLGELIAGLIVLVIVLTVLFIYVSSVMRFVLFDSVLTRECRVREGWKRRRNNGRRLFVWQLLLTVTSLAAMAILIGVPVAFAWMVGWFEHPKQHLLPLILGGVGLILVFLVLVAALAVVHVVTKDFVVPQMALENIDAFEGWRRLWAWIKEEKIGYLGYIGMKIVLAIGAGIAVGIIGIVILLMLLIPVGGMGFAAVLAGKTAGLTWNFYTIAVAVVVGCVVLSIFVFAVSFISVPAVVFFPAYSMYFLAPRYSPLAAVLQPAPIVPASPPLEPPTPPPQG